MNTILTKDKNYSAWLKELKTKVRLVQIKAAVKVNSELLWFYWELGQDIIDKQKNTKWGYGFLKQLSLDLSAEFPAMKGFSLTNLKYIKQWYVFYSQEIQKNQQAVGQNSSPVLRHEDEPIGQQVVAQLTQIPWDTILSSFLSVKTRMKLFSIFKRLFKITGQGPF
jgi:hypothetical protein